MPTNLMTEPWYKKGLRFKCTECGQCCTGAPGAVWVTEEEIEKISEHTGLEKEAFTRNIDGRVSLVEKKNYDCIFLNKNRCTIYPIRPKQCRTFPWWPKNLESPESWKRTAKECEGISDEAPLVHLEEIKKNLTHSKHKAQEQAHQKVPKTTQH